jgi:hypothetical protein
VCGPSTQSGVLVRHSNSKRGAQLDKAMAMSAGRKEGGGRNIFKLFLFHPVVDGKDCKVVQCFGMMLPLKMITC